MKLYALEIPETRADRISWLEQHLTGLNLTQLVAELQAIHAPDQPTELRTLLGDQLSEVLAEGLGVLSDAQIGQLLQNPACLFDLQEQILLSGSSCWQQVPEGDPSFDISFQSILLAQDGQFSVGSSASSGHVATQKHQSSAPNSFLRRPLVVSVLTAAIVLIGVALVERFSGQPDQGGVATVQGWGWDRPGALKSDVSAPEYLTGLADAAEDWFKKRPQTAADVAVRIGQFRQGCSTLIFAEHGPLDEEDRTWLVEKCRAWAVKLDSHLAAVEAGASPAAVLAAADETVNALIQALRNRATEQNV